ncbi:MAG: hypothetical protein J6P03_05080 [Opitutales bacterium]|nr:hypothetical protein [Opitutales bacterium]
MFKHYLLLIKRNPIKALASTMAAAMLAAAAVLLFFTAVFSVRYPRSFKQSVYNGTGFSLGADKIFTLFWDGKIRMRNVSITNRRDFEKREFLRVNRLDLGVERLPMLKGELAITSVDADIGEMFCLREKGYVYNLKEFIEGLKNSINFADKNGFKFIRVKIGKCRYADNSGKPLVLEKSAGAPIEIFITDISNPDAVNLACKKALEKSEATFVLQGIYF